MSFRLVLIAGLMLALVCACGGAGPTSPGDDEHASSASDGERMAGVTLEPDHIARLGIVTSPVAAAEFAAQTAGYGSVLPHDAFAGAVADVATAEAAARLSRAQLARAEELAGTPGAFSAEIQESARRQSAADEAALLLARRKLSAAFGSHPPWAVGHRTAMMDRIASGEVKLVRATFPLGALTGPVPRSLRLARPDPSGRAERWRTATVWAAPADASIPGRSLFALLEGTDAAEGERLDAWAVTGATESGALVPESAIVISDGGSWCYVERRPGTFVRTAVDDSRPADGGYFVTAGIVPGDRVVTAAAGLLLAREKNPGAEAD